MGQGRNDRDRLYADAARRHGGAIERLARGYEFDAELRRDLVQEIHAALWRSFATFEGQCSERSWVYRIAHNVAASHLVSRRRLSRESLVGLEAIEIFPDSVDLELETDERRIVDRLLAAIHRLAPIDRQVMLLYLEDLSAAEIGEVTGMSPGAVAVRIHRIKAMLARPFAETGALA